LKRELAFLILLIFSIGLPTIIAFRITLDKVNPPDYDFLYYFSLALVAVMAFLGSFSELVSLIEKLMGPKYAISNKGLARKFLNEISISGKRGINISGFISNLTNKYTHQIPGDNKQKEKTVTKVCDDLKRCNLIERYKDRVRITDEGETYRKRYIY